MYVRPFKTDSRKPANKMAEPTAGSMSTQNEKIGGKIGLPTNDRSSKTMRIYKLIVQD